MNPTVHYLGTLIVDLIGRTGRKKGKILSDTQNSAWDERVTGTYIAVPENRNISLVCRRFFFLFLFLYDRLIVELIKSMRKRKKMNVI